MQISSKSISCLSGLLVNSVTEDGVDGIDSNLVVGSFAVETLLVSESHTRRGGPVPLVIGYDLNAIVLPDSHARVSSAQVDSDRPVPALNTHYNSKSTQN